VNRDQGKPRNHGLDAEWQLFLERLPPRSHHQLLRSGLDQLMPTYLGILETAATSPTAREVATVLKDVGERADQFAYDLRKLSIRTGNEGSGAFNTASEAAADILANFLIKPDNRSVFEAALQANKALAAASPPGLKVRGCHQSQARLTSYPLHRTPINAELVTVFIAIGGLSIDVVRRHSGACAVSAGSPSALSGKRSHRWRTASALARANIASTIRGLPSAAGPGPREQAPACLFYLLPGCRAAARELVERG
jgi:hypothetical protein